ncbi:MAG: TrmH family RNA methyltransferase [Egibacteraceae bacterium]
MKAARRLAARRGRERAEAFLVEGPHAVGEAVDWLRHLFVTPAAATRHPALVDRVTKCGVEVTQVTEDVLSSIVDTVTPQGVVGVAALPQADLAHVVRSATLLVVGVRVADPGNVGAIVRVADAAGADAVVLTAGSVDPRNPKAVRASAGSLFHLPVLADEDLEAVLSVCRGRAMALVATDARAQMPYTEVDLRAPTALLFGNEAHGLPSQVRARCDAVVRLPLCQRPSGSADSLNLATTVAVLAYEAARQRASALVGNGP